MVWNRLWKKWLLKQKLILRLQMELGEICMRLSTSGVSERGESCRKQLLLLQQVSLKLRKRRLLLLLVMRLVWNSLKVPQPPSTRWPWRSTTLSKQFSHSKFPQAWSFLRNSYQQKFQTSTAVRDYMEGLSGFSWISRLRCIMLLCFRFYYFGEAQFKEAVSMMPI